MALVPHAESLRQRLARAPGDAARFADELAELVARLHGAGWYHRDLYLEHVVIEAPTERLVLLDLARARSERAPRRRWFVKDLGALASTPGLDEAARCRFFDAYCELRGIPPRARAAWVRSTLARARRIARHAPRHVDPATREGGL
jgi:tRNA A-37 threonylcarbamoyl transferase component Bud32